MTDPWLYDPAATRELVLAHRGDGAPAVRCVVSDVVWGEVVVLLRWARAGRPEAPLATGVLWRLAAGCGDLLRRLPALGDELGEPWRSAPVVVPEQVSVVRAADRLTGLLLAPGSVPLQTVAAAVDALGEAAIGALVEEAAP